MDVGGCCGIGRPTPGTVLNPFVSSFLACKFDNWTIGPDDVGAYDVEPDDVELDDVEADDVGPDVGPMGTCGCKSGGAGTESDVDGPGMIYIWLVCSHLGIRNLTIKWF